MDIDYGHKDPPKEAGVMEWLYTLPKIMHSLNKGD